jgi:hypothetical protein
MLAAGRLGLGFLCGFETCCWVICLPMTTRATPTSLLVPCMVALHAEFDPADGPEMAMRALEMSIASLRAQPTWLMRWPAMESGMGS